MGLGIWSGLYMGPLHEIQATKSTAKNSIQVVDLVRTWF